MALPFLTYHSMPKILRATKRTVNLSPARMATYAYVSSVGPRRGERISDRYGTPRGHKASDDPPERGIELPG